MIDLNNVIRTERNRRYNSEDKLTKVVKVYILKCKYKNCNNEIRLTSSCKRKHSGRCRSCADKDTGETNRRTGSIKNRARPYEALYNKFCYDRKRFNQNSNMTYDEFLEFVKEEICHYCDEKVTWAEYNLSKNGYSYNLDRKDNEKGYTKDNCVICCWDCNETKGSKFTYEEFMLLSPIIKQIKVSRNV